MLSELIDHCLRPGLPPELNKLARTLKAWFANGKPNWRVLGSIVVR